jgi:hypothetical protein
VDSTSIIAQACQCERNVIVPKLVKACLNDYGAVGQPPHNPNKTR